jgi:Na+-driven multidrug efflux pump
MLKTKKRLLNNKNMIISIFALAWPSIIEQALQTIVQYADSAMVADNVVRFSLLLTRFISGRWKKKLKFDK